MDLSDKTALITGSSRGIGKAIALRFARDGARVAVTCVQMRDMAEDVANQIRAGGGEAIALQGDVGEKAAAERLVGDAIEAFGHLDILVSNAGIVIDKRFIDTDYDDWRAAIETNLQGFFNMTQAVLPHMIGRG